jgi:predicted choloylglycine hydrolase
MTESHRALTFTAFEELEPGEKMRRHFERFWPAYEQWFLREGDARRPTYARCLKALKEHMPEIVPVYERLCELVDAGDRAARFLSLYRPTPYMTGCSQATWLRDKVALVRNYDYAPHLCEGVNLHSAWTNRRVIAMTDCFWGVLDGINEDGLAVALAFGGRKKTGKGFGIPLILRYVLETCATVNQAVDALQRIPSHMCYNVSLVDRHAAHATVMLAPDRPAEVTADPVCTNHQGQVEWPEHAALTQTLERERFLAERVDDPAETLDTLVMRFLHPPLFHTTNPQRWRTLYTACYLPRHETANYIWPGDRWVQRFDAFTERVLPFADAIGFRA